MCSGSPSGPRSPGKIETIPIWIAIAAPASHGLRSSTSASADSRPRASGTDSRQSR